MAVLSQSTVYVRTFPMYLSGTKTPATGKTVTVNLSKNGGAFGVSAGAVAEIANGWYKVSLTTVDTNTVGDLAFNCTAAACDPTDFADQVGAVPANVIQINGQRTDGNNATLSLASLNIQNSAGSAIVAASSGGNGHGIAATGNGTGDGIACIGGATGHGVLGQGGATSGSGLFLLAVGSGTGITATGAANGHGIQAIGNGSGDGLLCVAGATGHGLTALGGASSGHGILAQAVGNGSGLFTVGVGNPSLSAGQGISGPLDVATYNAMADYAMARDWGANALTISSRSTLNALRMLRNKWSISGSTMTVTAENDTTPAWTATLVTDGTALPVVSFTGN